MDQVEEWRAIHGGYYEVSNLGNVRRAKPGIATFVGRPLFPIESGRGYDQVALSGLTDRRAYVHHLVAEAFLGHRGKQIVNHKDGNKRNNASSNLEYVTARGNCLHALATMKRRKGPTKPKKPKTGPQTGANHWSARNPEKIARGSRMPHCKLSAEAVTDARRRIASGEMQKTLAEELGISVAQMSRIVRNKRWTYL